MNEDRYSMSFTVGGLFRHESVKLAILYMKYSNWKAVRNDVICNNILDARTQGTLKRIYNEIASRLKKMSDEELDFLVKATYQEQGYLLWIAICRRYQFIADFAVEIVRERYISMKINVSYDDFNAFFNRKAEWHPELDKLQSRTINSLRQVLFKIMHEVDLLATNNTINMPIFSPGLMDLIFHGNSQDFLYFPIFESDLKRMAK